MGLAVPLAKSTLTSPLSNFFMCSAFCRPQMDLRSLVTNEVAEPTSTSPTCTPSLRVRRWRQGCAGGKCSVCCCSLRTLMSRERTRHLLFAALACGLVVAAIALLRVSLCSRTLATSGAALVRFWQLSIESSADIANDSEVRRPSVQKRHWCLTSRASDTAAHKHVASSAVGCALAASQRLASS